MKYRSWLRIVLANGLVLLGLLVLLEIGGQVHMRSRPATRGLFWKPDRTIGWTLTPGLQSRWGGHEAYAREFLAPITTNSAGFRDRERSLEKPIGTIRIALLGDSLVEALQVPFERTAGQVLEARLNRTGKTYEVLNFGVSAFGLGQMLLTWERYASCYAPDYVFVLVAGFHMKRTVTPTQEGAIVGRERRSLEVRPTFALDSGRLVRRPARDFEAFITAQEEFRQRELGGQTMVEVRPRLFIATYGRILWATLRARIAPPATDWLADPGPETLQINLRILEEFAVGVARTGATFGVLDYSRYALPSSVLPEVLRPFAAEHAVSYLPLYESLQAAEKQGRSVRFASDGHLNVDGNQILGEALQRGVDSTGLR